jgi:hypothetical protein
VAKRLADAADAVRAAADERAGVEAALHDAEAAYSRILDSAATLARALAAEVGGGGGG